MKPSNENAVREMTMKEMIEQGKADLEVMDSLIDGLREELSKIYESLFETQKGLNRLNFQYKLLKKEHKQSVEAVPIKHGRWVGNERHTSCSICGQTFCVPDGQDGHLDMTFYKYCPNCGSRMDAND